MFYSFVCVLYIKYIASISDPAYIQFAQNCAIDFVPARKLLEFPQGCIDMDNTLNPANKKIFIRSCYAPLFEQALNASNIKQPLKRPVSPFILGTPGCGKSLFRMYFCHRLLDMANTQKKDVYILFQKANADVRNKSVFVVRKLVSDGNATTLTYRPEATSQLSADVNTWEHQDAIVISLIDVSQGKYLTVAVGTKYNCYFSSPNRELTKDKDRLKTRSVIDLYMGLWLLSEAKEANHILQLGILDSDIEYRFFKFGGSARAILENPALAEEYLKDALIKIGLNAPLSTLLCKSETDFASEFSHSIFHVTSVSPNFTIAQFQWASTPIKQMVAEIALKKMTHELEGIMNSPEIPLGTKGEMVEALWFERFVLATQSDSKENMMTVNDFSSLSASLVKESDLSKCLTSFTVIKIRWGSKNVMLEALQKALVDIRTEAHPILLRPQEFDMMAIDGIIVMRLNDRICVLYLQATIRKEHPTSINAAKYLDSLIAICSADIFQALVFIVPKHRFDDWARQIVHGKGASSTLPQYAILPGTRLSDNAKSGLKRKVEEERPVDGPIRVTRSSARKGI